MKKNNLEIQQSKEVVAEEKVIIDNNKWEISVPNDLLLELSEDTYFALSPAKFEELKLVSKTIFRITNEVLLNTVQQKNFESWIESRYGVVKDLWNNGKNGVDLMRIDYAWDQQGNFKVLELNTACQYGWELSSWIKPKKATNEKKGVNLALSSMFYIEYLTKKLGSKIVFIETREDYDQELDVLLQQIAILGGQGKIILLSENTVQEIINFSPTGLLWKSPSVLVEQAELVHRVAKLNLPQLPSFESLFIAGDKAFLALLQDKDTTGAIPKTFVLSKTDLAQNLNFLEKNKAVLKPGSLARGEGIKFGKNLSAEDWEKKIKSAMSSNEEWIIQELCYLQNTKDGKYEDVAVFLVDDLVKGVVSRISTNEIVNVSQGGKFQAVILQEEKTNQEYYNELQSKIEFSPK